MALAPTDGVVSVNAIVAQQVAAAEMNWDLPCGKPLFEYSTIGKLREATNQEPSASWVRKRNSTPRW